MKTLYLNPGIGRFDITDPQFITVVIERKASYRRFSQYLYDGFPDHIGLCSLTQDGKDVAVEDCSLYIENPLNLDLNTKANLNALYKFLKKSYFDELNQSVEQIQEKLNQICQEIRLDFEAELEMDGALRVDDVFKMGNLKFADTSESFLERLTKYVVASKELRKVNLVFINHLRDYLEDEEMKQFIQELQYRGITLVDIETFPCESIISDEKKLVVDQDMCVVSM